MLINPITLMLFSRTLNRYIARDKAALLALKKLAGKVLCLDINAEDAKQHLYFLFHDDNITLEQICHEKPHATLIASPVTLARLFASKNTAGLNVRIEGQIDVVQDIQHFFASLEIDWEEQLSKLTGDVFAHHFSRLARDTKNILQSMVKTTGLNTVEFLQEESCLLAIPECVATFCKSVDTLSMQTDRLAARIAHLKKKYEPLS